MDRAEIVSFVERVTGAMGLSLSGSAADTPDGVRIDLDGGGGEMLLRRRGEALNALQQVVQAAFRDALPDGQRIAIDCGGFRRDKDQELRRMAIFLAEKALSTRTVQEIGPLNPYERRIVHMAVAEVAGVTSESVGDAHIKTVTIAAGK